MELPKGMRDFAPQEKILRDKLIQTITEVFQNYGFNPLETPIVEKWDVLSAKFGASDESDVMKEIYKLRDQGERELGLRYDLTVPAARFVAMHPELKMPFKRYQIGTVYRDGPVKLGRYREFMQCDFDIFGCKQIAADIEILKVFLAVFKKLDIELILEVNDRRVLSALIESTGVKPERTESVMISIDKLDKLGEEGVTRELVGKGFSETKAKKILEVFDFSGTNEEKLTKVESLLPKNEILDELKELLQEPQVQFNPSLARGLGYYTGIVFEGRIKNSEITSSVCAGGRYDTLVGSLIGKKVPAIGGSFGVEPLMEYLRLRAKGEQNGFPKTVTQVHVIPIKCFDKAIPIVQELRDAGINTEIDLMERGISKNLEYANSLDIPYVVIVGPQELEEGKVKLKDMRLGEEKLVDIKNLISELERYKKQ